MKQFSFTWVLAMALHYLVFAQAGTMEEGVHLHLFKHGNPLNEEVGGVLNGGFYKDLPIEIPHLAHSSLIINHTGYSVAYNERHEQPFWVAYALTAKMTIPKVGRKDQFRIDPKVATGTANGKDYTRSGFDRGHLVPAADMGWSSQAMNATFYYSNISPQVPAFNRGVWKRLEVLMREWARVYNKVYIVTGPVLTDSLGTIGKNQVTVPRYFYKVVLDYRPGQGKAIGFILSNRKSQRPLWDFAVPVDSVESLTEIDFFPQVPEDVEEKVEKTVCVPCWEWHGEKPDRVKPGQRSEAALVQCNGVTRKGYKCKRRTRSPNGQCFQHGGN